MMPIYPNIPAFLAGGVDSCPVSDEQLGESISKEELTSNGNRLTSAHFASFNARYGHSSVMSVPCSQDAVTVTAVTTLNVTHPQIKSAKGDTSIKVCCCSNVFGRQCVEAWLIRRNDCPFCRLRFFSRINSRDELAATVNAVVEMAVRRAVEEYPKMRGEWEGDGEGSD
jgi:hypothetical protein